MPRTARIVIPGIAHHVTQRGNHRQPVFFTDDDYTAYIGILATALRKTGTQCLAWCLMPNHVHLMLTPRNEDGLRAPLSSAHTTYVQRINHAQGFSGHLFQGRFASYPMDDAHMMVAARYIENNPVKAGLVKAAGDWPWSSARAHISGAADPLADPAVLGRHVTDWPGMLAIGLEASDGVDVALKSGRPLAGPGWIESQGLMATSPAKRGRPFAAHK